MLCSLEDWGHFIPVLALIRGRLAVAMMPDILLYVHLINEGQKGTIEDNRENNRAVQYVTTTGSSSGLPYSYLVMCLARVDMRAITWKFS